MKNRLGLALVVSLALAPSAVHAGPIHKVALYTKWATLRARATLGNLALKSVGYAELAGLKFKVKPYEAQVSKDLWRGSRVDSAGLEKLKARGFGGVVGLTAERDLDVDANAEGLSKKRIKIIDNHTPTYAQVGSFLRYVDDHKAKGPVYVHCEAGIGRTGIMVAAYRMKVQGWDGAHAVAEARKLGMVQRSQIEFIRSLYKNLDKI